MSQFVALSVEQPSLGVGLLPDRHGNALVASGVGSKARSEYQERTKDKAMDGLVLLC